jgi:hypothetical protein
VTEIQGAPDGVDVAALAAEMARRAGARGGVPPAEGPPAFVGAEAEPLARARSLIERPGVEYEIGWRTPLLGQAWAGLRQLIHGEARLYVDALMARQAELDLALLDAIAELGSRVARLESQLRADDRPSER